jgi:hypothetical protein
LVVHRQAGQRSLYRVRGEALRELASSLAGLAGRAGGRPAAAAELRPARGLPELGRGVVD